MISAQLVTGNPSPDGKLYPSWQPSSNWRTEDTRKVSPSRRTVGLLPVYLSADENDMDFFSNDPFGSEAWNKQKAKRSPHRESRGQNGKSRSPAKNTPSDSNRENEVLEKHNRSLSSAVSWLQKIYSRMIKSNTATESDSCKSSPSSTANGVSPQITSSSVSTGNPAPHTATIVQQANLFCGHYIYHRLTLKGYSTRKTTVTPYNSFLAQEIFAAGQELERLYPRVYNDVSRRIAMTMSSPQIVRRALTAVLEGIFRTGITWAKMVSMMAISGAFAEECVLQGHPNYVEDVVASVRHYVEHKLTDWLAAQGGWEAFPVFKEQSEVRKSTKRSVIIGALFLGTAVFILIVNALI